MVIVGIFEWIFMLASHFFPYNNFIFINEVIYFYRTNTWNLNVRLLKIHREIFSLFTLEQKTGGVAVLKRGQRFVYYLITKEKYWNKPTYQTLRNSLEAMRSHCQKNRVTNVSMPRIGCGLDGLNWNKVVEIVKGVFSNTDISITVFTL